jgi:hypothetical protein
MNAGISNIKQRRSGVKRFLSLGAGVQSSYLLLQAATGVRAPYDYAIFANTKREPRKVMEWLGWLKEEVARSKYPFPIIEVSAGDLGAEAVRVRTSKKTGNRYVKTLLPAYVAKANGKRAMMGRRCTVDYKIRVLTKTQRKLAKVPRARRGVTPKVMAEITVGFSYDEWQRMKPNEEKWAVNVFPLVDEKVTRDQCIAWVEETYGRTPPKSACVFCPFHGDAYWQQMKDQEPEEFAQAVQFDTDLRAAAEAQTGTARLQGAVYLHESLRPLSQVVFKDTPERAQQEQFGFNCAGLCGV